MYYSLTFYDRFGSKNTYDDWHLVPTKRPSFQPPEFKSNMIEIPGRDGLIDISTALTGYPSYGNRTGSLEFLIYNSPYKWHETYSMVANYLHGQYRKVYMEEDPDFYYEGRFTLDEFNSGKNYSTISIDYELQPYKISRFSTSEPWLWDPFNFQTGVIISDLYNDLHVDTSQDEESYQQIFNSLDIEERHRDRVIGRMTVCPTFKVISEDGSGLDIWVENDELELSSIQHVNDGETKIPEFIFSMQHPNNGVRVSAKGVGIISIDFNVGSL